MNKVIVYVATIALALLIADEIVPGVTLDNLKSTLLAAVVIGILNSVVKPILIFLTLPITILTLGLFILVINVALFTFTAWLLPGFVVDGFIPALLGTFLISLVSIFIGKIGSKD